MAHQLAEFSSAALYVMSPWGYNSLSFCENVAE
jgi:hypothetical protein